MTIYRILNTDPEDEQIGYKKPPVLFMHGLMDDALGMLSNGKKNSPTMIALRNGADVWVGNSRGTLPSLNHVRLDWERDASKYWDFTFAEIAKYDLPAFFQFIQEKTGFEKIGYVGHSMGTTSLFINLTLDER